VVENFQGKNVGLVDLESAFDSLDDSGTPLPGNVEMICRTTYMCGKDEYNNWIYGTPNADIHPNRRGHNKIAKTIYKIYKEM